MGTEQQPGDPAPGTETVTPATQATAQTPSGETPQGSGQQSQTQQPSGDQPDSSQQPQGEQQGQQPQQQTQQPDPAKASLLADLAGERSKRQAAQARITELEQQVKDAPSKETLDAVQRKYERLEAFAQAVGLGKALDSKTFSTALFETDEDIAELVTKWNKDHPSATSVALGSAAAAPASNKPDPNELLRAAFKGQ